MENGLGGLPVDQGGEEGAGSRPQRVVRPPVRYGWTPPAPNVDENVGQQPMFPNYGPGVLDGNGQPSAFVPIPSRGTSRPGSSASTGSTVRSRRAMELEMRKKQLEIEEAFEAKERDRQREFEAKQRAFEEKEKDRAIEKMKLDMEIAKEREDAERREDQNLGDDDDWYGGPQQPANLDPFDLVQVPPFPRNQFPNPKFASTPAYPAFANNAPLSGFGPQTTFAPEISAMMQLMHQQSINQSQMLQQQINASRDQTQAIILQGEAMKSLRTPKDLPKFDGKLEDWPRFIGDYRESTRVRNVSNIDNLGRLQKALTGKAMDAVRSLLIHPDNLTKVIDTLELLFGQPVKIIEQLIANVQSLKRIGDQNAEQIVEFSTVVCNLATTIKSFNKNTYLYNPQLIGEIVDKLPAIFKQAWLMTRKSEEDSILDLSEFLNNQAKAWATLPTSKTAKSSPSDGAKGKKPEAKKEKVNAAVDKSQDPCVCCKKTNHGLDTCFAFKKLTPEEKTELVKESKLCFNCFGPWKPKQKCEQPPGCECGKSHHKLLHLGPKTKPNETASKKKDEETPNSVVSGSVETITGSVGAVMLKVVPVELFGPKRRESSFAFLDDGSTVSLIDAKLAKKLGLKGRSCQLQLDWINNEPKMISSQRVNLEIKGKNQKESYTLKNLCTFPDLDLLCQSVDVEKLKDNFPDLDLEDVVEYRDAKPMILIGQDNAYLSQRPECEVNSEPIVSKTRLGAVVHGPVGAVFGDGGRVFRVAVVSAKGDQTLHEMVKHHFTTEDFGVKVPVRAIQSKENDRAVAIMETTTRRTEGGWETGLLWKKDDPCLPNNRDVAVQRLASIERKLDRDPEFAKKYVAKMEENFANGFAHVLGGDELERKTGVWYLPHFHAHNPKKPGKVRIVLDAASKYRGMSLNDHLLTGPDLYNPLPEILMKFRQHQIGLSGDIKDFFPSIKIIDEDVHYQRFLYRGMDREKPPRECQMDVMIFGAACSPSSAQFIRNKNAGEYADKFPEAAKAIQEKFFMDDYLDSGSSEEAMEQKLKQVIDICANGNFKLCNIVSSSEELLRTVPESLRATDQKFMLTDSYTERVLGLYWNPKLDTFTFTTNFVRVDPEIVDGTRCPTKREILKLIMSIFDPLGFIANFTSKAKILQQDVWRSGIGWDDEIQPNILPRWNRWLEELRTITEVSIPRCMDPGIQNATSIQLHTFVDASEQAFSGVVYLRVQQKEKVTVSLVMAKSRVAPLRPLSIPRLELQGALLGSRLSKTISNTLELEIDESFFWSDSRTVICWLRSDARKFQPFVAHRVGEIEELTDGGNWNWIPTKENVADEATRDTIPTDFSTSSRWLNGPEFLKLPADQWPKEKVKDSDVDPDLLELKPEVVYQIQTVDSVVDFSRFSSWWKLKRVVAYVYRFARKLTKLDYGVGTLTFEELEKAETRILQWSQEQSFSLEYAQLCNGKSVHSSSSIYELSPVLEDGLLKMSGRTTKSKSLGLQAKRQIILSPKHPVTKLLIMDFHKKFHHQGRETVLNELRQKYWILCGRAAVRKAFNECLTCRLLRPKPVIQEMGQLPSYRVTRQVRAFMETGLDYFGPVEVTIGRRREKRWVALFTCMTVRAIHLELAHHLNTDSAIMAVRRFVARRGTARTIHCDNGTNFHGADSELKKALDELDQEVIISDLAKRGIIWKFIPPSAPHMGGAWERMVQSVKVCLRATLKEKTPQEEVLRTALAEVEYVVNSRPITYVSSDSKDPKALCPNDFLIGPECEVSVPNQSSERDMTARKLWKRSQAIADEFWRRWTKEYLPTLNRRGKWHESKGSVAVGDIVFIVDGDQPRGTWPKGVITQLFPGKDGKVRVVEIKTENGLFKRHIAKILTTGSNS